MVKKVIIFFVISLAAILLLILKPFSKENPTTNLPHLKIFAYASFVSSWGPGPKLKQGFEKTCRCVVDYTDVSDSGVLLQRLRLEGSKTEADVVMGFDQLDLLQAQEALSWKTLDIDRSSLVDEVKNYRLPDQFAVYDWGPLAFIVRKSEVKDRPTKLTDLLKPEWKNQIAIEDPRTSSPGLQFLFWNLELYGDSQAFIFLENFLKQVHSVSASWSTAYGLFQHQQVRTALSYLTSPIYHEVEEKNADYAALIFEEGHPVQYELVGIPGFCQNCDLAQKFVQFLLLPSSQKLIMEKNYMLPVLTGVKDGTPFARVPEVKILPPTSLERMGKKNEWIELWTDARRKAEH